MKITVYSEYKQNLMAKINIFYYIFFEGFMGFIYCYTKTVPKGIKPN